MALNIQFRCQTLFGSTWSLTQFCQMFPLTLAQNSPIYHEKRHPRQGQLLSLSLVTLVVQIIKNVYLIWGKRTACSDNFAFIL